MEIRNPEQKSDAPIEHIRDLGVIPVGNSEDVLGEIRTRNAE